MTINRSDLGRPIRVVVFCGGPTLDRSVKQFICLLDGHPEIQFIAAFCQSQGQGLVAIITDLWRRRGVLAVPLCLTRILDNVRHCVKNPRAAIDLKRSIGRRPDCIRFVSDIHAKEVLDWVGSVKPDLGLIYGSPVLKPEVYEIPIFGTLGIHHGRIPEYRGKKTTFWAMYNGEETAGVTIQRVNSGIDTGEIVKQGEVGIGWRSQRSVWDELEALGLKLYIETIIDVKRGRAEFQVPTGMKGTPYRDPRLRDIFRFQLKQAKSRFARIQRGSDTKLCSKENQL